MVASFLKPSNLRPYQYNISVAPFLQQMTKETFAQYGIETFRYGRLYFKECKYLYLSTHTDWLRHHFEHHEGTGPTFERQFQCAPLHQYHYFIWPTFKPQDYFLSDFYDFGIWHGLSVYRRDYDYIEGWCFATSRANENILNFYLNHKNIIEAFIHHFRMNDSFGLIPLEDACFARGWNASNLKIYQPSLYQILTQQWDSRMKMIKTSVRSSSHISLSGREAECGYLIAHGRTVKDIGKALDISPRTVEEYIRRFKRKANISSKAELIAFIENQGDMLVREI